MHRTRALTFDPAAAEVWPLVADATCTRRLGLSIFDNVDRSRRDAYDAGTTAGQALEAGDTFAALFGGGG